GARRGPAHRAARWGGAAPRAGPARTGGGGRGHGAVGAAGGGACGRGAASGRALRGRQEVGREVGAGGQSRSSGSVTGRSLTTPTRIIGASASDWLRETAAQRGPAGGGTGTGPRTVRSRWQSRAARARSSSGRGSSGRRSGTRMLTLRCAPQRASRRATRDRRRASAASSAAFHSG